jgi:hypothetical protein
MLARRRVAAVLGPAACLALIGVLAAAPPAGADLIVPGRRIGPLRIGMGRADFERAVGLSRADSVGYTGGWYSLRLLSADGKVEAELRLRTHSVFAISTGRPGDHTASGIRPGTSVRVLRARLHPRCLPPDRFGQRFCRIGSASPRRRSTLFGIGGVDSRIVTTISVRLNPPTRREDPPAPGQAASLAGPNRAALA